MYLKYIYFVQSILQIHLYIYVHNKNTLQLYIWNTKLVKLKSAKLEQLMLYLRHFNSAEVQLNIYWSIFDCAKVYNQIILQVHFKYLAFKDRYYIIEIIQSLLIGSRGLMVRELDL